ncbi:type III secretion system stator protein SctL [Phyllobacterium myrsinacearum]|uniref:Type 3 secretion system stator protein n=1 Tax=Phyllobacterium myrsinacearum TaxID=28101 RepID=A0A2S9JQG5_9HYPH|nr:type III secretion system stator protein SctL [Phyllobacterium myrsinacearum]PRD55421.1 HrpE/YscL family type III secretion apparatus protein [Phyllobacterium myrsinacearum]PWV91761.1 type III secretion protein L [Phyllobacterium myrsinacearum]RZS77397.1 type III secretion protein L [Phyllobacterium myrsinacearum]RZV05830.1 type III secretion protein L [Phyllobacterium myrsinacearum]
MMDLPKTPAARIISARDTALWTDAQAMLAAARQEADDIRSAAQAAFDASKAEGYRQGLQQGEQDAAILVAETATKIDRDLEALQEQVIDLSLSVVEQLIGEIDNPVVVAKLASNAIELLRYERALTVYVAPELEKEVKNLLQEISTGLEKGLSVRITGDPRLDSRNCLVVSPSAVVNAGLDAQLSIIRQALIAARDEAEFGAV